MRAGERETRVGSSLAARVAKGTAASAAVVAVLAATASLLVASRLIRDGEDARLRATASAFAAELPQGADATSLSSAIKQEESELAPASIRIAVRDARSVVGGDARLPSPPPGSCASHDAAELTVRACAVQAGPYIIVTGSTQARGGWAGLLAACACAALVAAMGAGVLGRRAARWALAPLTDLRRSLDRIDAAEPRRVSLQAAVDCAEVTTVRDALQALLLRLANALDAARGFSSNAAHELRTPLTVIRGELDLLAEEPLSAEAARSVEKLRARVGALTVLTERLLALATAGERVDSASDAVALEDVVRDVVARLETSRRVRVTPQLDSTGMVRGDETLLAALVDNAIDNALKFSNGAPVSVRLRDDAARVVLDVIDGGPGIAEEDRRRAFEPFFRTAGARGDGTPGHGIGLALIATIVRAHRGTVAFAPREGSVRGACLRIELPGWTPRANG